MPDERHMAVVIIPLSWLLLLDGGVLFRFVSIYSFFNLTIYLVIPSLCPATMLSPGTHNKLSWP